MKKLLITLVALVPFVANAGFYAEPYVGYGIGDYEATALNIKGTADTSGSLYGARLGGSFLGLMGGFEYSVESFSSNKSGTSDNDITDMGVFVGYQFPSLVPVLGKVWGSYFFNSEIDDLEGTGMALGVGFAPIPIPLPFLSLHFNLEYRTHEWDKTGVDAEDTQYIFSVSVPINI